MRSVQFEHYGDYSHNLFMEIGIPFPEVCVFIERQQEHLIIGIPMANSGFTDEK